MAYKNIRFTVEGVSPLLLHSDRLANPLLEETQALKKVTAIRKKTEENHTEIARLSYLGSFYNSDYSGEVVIDTKLLEGTIFSAAKLQKLGVIAKRSIIIAEGNVKLLYEGPQTPDALWKAQGKWVDFRTVDVQGSRIMRYRPRFNTWGLTFEVMFDNEQLEMDQLVQIVQNAGSKMGLGDYRPKFGRFSVENVEQL